MGKIRHLILTARQIVKGILSFFLPKIRTISSTGGSSSARYCYSVFLRHLVLLKESGLTQFPQVVAEIGPGDSIGTGLAALIAGAEKYYGFDVVSYSIPQKERQIFEDLVVLFSNRAPIPDEEEFPAVKPKLTSYEFPKDILTEKHLTRALNPERIDYLRQALKEKNTSHSIITYKVPWTSESILEKDSVDWIFSQAVMEHVEDLETSYARMWDWLKPEGFMSYQIDFKCHGMSSRWNGHWAFNPLTWKLIKGRALYLLNRKTYQDHLNLLETYHFSLLHEQRHIRSDGFPTRYLSKEYRHLDEETLHTAGSFMVAKRK